MISFAQNYLTRGFWGDEAWTSLISQLPYVQMLKTTAADFHPPGYYTVVELVYKFLPPTEIVTRSISIFFYFLTGLMVYKLASDVKGRTFGILSTLVVLLNPIFFRYAMEARNYTMFAFCATGSVYFLLKFSTLRSDSGQASSNIKNAVFFILFTTLGIYTHYYMFFVLVAQGLYLLLFDRRIFVKTMMAYVVVGILYLGWIPFLLGQLKSVSGGYWIGGIDWKHTHREALMRILGGETPGLLQLWLYRFSVILILVGLLQHVRQKSFEKPPLRSAMQSSEGQAYILIWLWAIVPFILATLPGLTIFGFKFPLRPIFFWRYLIPAAVPLAILVVHSAQKMPKLIFATSVSLVIVLSLVIDYLTFTSYPHNFKQEYAQKVVPNIKSTDKIVTVLPAFAEVLYYRNRFGLKNEIIVSPVGLVQFSGKSLLDAYAARGVVKISGIDQGRYFQLEPGPSVELINKNLQL